MSTAEHSLTVPVPSGTTTAHARDLLAFIDTHAPAEAQVTADAGRLIATWTTDTAAPPVRGSTVQLGFGVAPGPVSAEVLGQRTADVVRHGLR